MFKVQMLLGLSLALAAILGILTPEMALIGAAFLTTSTAQLGNGTILQISAGSPTSFITVNNCHNIAWDDGSNPDVEVTNLTSSAKEFLPGFSDAGTLTADVDYDAGDAGQAALQSAKLSRVACDVKIILPGGTTPNWTARGFVKKFGKQLGVDQAVKAALEIRITGPWTQS